ncbi:hypothetical protein EIP86_011534 [Pleurotus ostreatoroseus]|nr:hypothetical protein EIP86_011534 [Pleurotus ostreatoroseus]
MHICFKLHGAFLGIKRRVSFDHLPTWIDFAARVGPLYDIPDVLLGVSYIDEEEDQVFVSSEEELQEYYRLYWYSKTSHDRPELFKFTVHNMRALRIIEDKALPSTPGDAFLKFNLEVNSHRSESSTMGPGFIDYTKQHLVYARNEILSTNFSASPDVAGSSITSAFGATGHVIGTPDQAVSVPSNYRTSMISPTLEVQSHLMTDTFTPAAVDFTSWLSTLDEQELETILKQIEESPKDKGKERAIELTHDTRANESLATLSSLATKPYASEGYPWWRAQIVLEDMSARR